MNKRHYARNTTIRSFQKYRYTLYQSKDRMILLFFSILGIILVSRLFYLQVIQANHYENQITSIHQKESTLEAQRGNIFIQDKANQPIQVTQNITLYDLFIEPQHFANETNKENFVELITPILYSHLCEKYGSLIMTAEQCIRNVEVFASTKILPDKPQVFYTGSGTTITANTDSLTATGVNRTGYQAEYDNTMASFTPEAAYDIIQQTLDAKINLGERSANYLGFFTDPNILNALNELDFIQIYENYAYIIPAQVPQTEIEIYFSRLQTILETYQYNHLIESARNQMTPKLNTYVSITNRLHPELADQITTLKREHQEVFYTCQPSIRNRLVERVNNYESAFNLQTLEEHDQYCDENSNMIGLEMSVPLLHGVGLDSYNTRYYPYDNFMSHTLGYVGPSGNAIYGVEEYMDTQLRGRDGTIQGRSSSLIGDIGANEFDVEEAVDGQDIHLTIDQNIQRYIESILPGYQRFYNADAISVVVMDPHTGEVKALGNTPNFNPNNLNSAFRYEPLDPERADIVDDLSYIDVHLFIEQEDGTMRKATTEERQDPTIIKRIANNTYGSEAFVDKTIKYAYEPGSVFKPLTAAIAVDLDEIDIDDFYDDDGEATLTVGGGIEYTIRNVSSSCLGTNTYLNALIYSCNVGMIDIIRQIGKEPYYNYLEKLGFGTTTNIELAGEEPGFIEEANTASLSRFFNNSFGLGLRATPIQMAQSFATLINGGLLIQPTIIDRLYDPNTDTYDINEPTVVRRVFKKETADQIGGSLFTLVDENPVTKENVAVAGFSLGGKTGTSEIPFRGRYLGNEGRTNTSFIGVVTQDNPNYIIVVQIRRPRTSRWGAYTAAPLFQDIAEFIIAYDLIQS